MRCACGKDEDDGVRCKMGATHLSLVDSMERYRKMNPHVSRKRIRLEEDKPKRERLHEDLPLFRRERL